MPRKTKSVAKSSGSNPAKLTLNANESKRLESELKLPEFRLGKNGLEDVRHQGIDQYVAKLKVLGSASQDFHNYVIQQIARLCPEVWEAELNAAIAFVASLEPKNEAECCVIVQMFAAHSLSMHFARNASRTSDTEVLEVAAKRFEKSSRLYVDLHAALAKMRGEGQQKVTVEHVTVQAGGQAIVGTVQHGGGSNESK